MERSLRCWGSSRDGNRQVSILISSQFKERCRAYEETWISRSLRHIFILSESATEPNAFFTVGSIISAFKDARPRLWAATSALEGVFGTTDGGNAGSSGSAGWSTSCVSGLLWNIWRFSFYKENTILQTWLFDFYSVFLAVRYLLLLRDNSNRLAHLIFFSSSVPSKGNRFRFSKLAKRFLRLSFFALRYLCFAFVLVYEYD